MRLDPLAWITTVLDVLGLLLIAAGLGAAAWTVLGPAALAAAGVVVVAGSWLTDFWWARGADEDQDELEVPEPVTLPRPRTVI